MIFSEDKRLSVYYISRIKFPFRNFNKKSILLNEQFCDGGAHSPFNSGSKVFLARDNRVRIGVFYCNLPTVTAKVAGRQNGAILGKKTEKHKIRQKITIFLKNILYYF